MKTIYAAVPLAAVAMLLAGCKGFWDPLPSNNGGGGSLPDAFYVLNNQTSQIAAYTISSGSLSAISGSPYTLIAAPASVAVAPGGGFLYVSTGSGIYAYSISSSGSLTVLNNGSVISQDAAKALQVGPSGTWLIDAALSGGQVQLDAIPLNSNGLPGTNVASRTFSISTADIKQMVLSPKADYLFLALGTGGAIAVPFNANSSAPLGSSAKTILAPSSNQGVLSVAVDPSERVFYVGETSVFSTGTTGGLLAYSYSSLGSNSAPTQITGSPIASGGTSPSAILAEAAGNYVYVANGNGTASSDTGTINWFTVMAAGISYSITAGSSVTTGVFPVGLAEDNKDQYVLVVSQEGNPDLEAFPMSAGALSTPIKTSTGNDPVNAVAIAPLP